MRITWMMPVILVAAAVLLASGCSARASTSSDRGAAKQTSIQPQTNQQKPAPTEKIPSGDIPDSQQFVTFVSKVGHYRLEVPEGWARTIQLGDVSFVSKLDGLSVHLGLMATTPTVSILTDGPVKKLISGGNAVTIHTIVPVTMHGEQAIRLVFDSNSQPDAVTGKRVRLENNMYFFYRGTGGTLAELRMWAPVGADNVDQWRRISSSFTWTK